MSNRRTFLKHAGMISLASLPESLPADSQDKDKQTAGTGTAPAPESSGIVLENAEMRLVISTAGFAQSLMHKATGQECLVKNTGTPMFTVTQYRPYDNELQLAYPARAKEFPVEHVRRENDRLIVTFALVGYKASIRLKFTDAYIAFQLESLTYHSPIALRHKSKTPIDETLIVQLPVRDRKNFGDWLNVMWDDAVAVNLLATDPYAKIDADPRQGQHLFRAGTVDAVKQEGVGAALIVTQPSHLLDRIARVEEDFDLPRGVESRPVQGVQTFLLRSAEDDPRRNRSAHRVCQDGRIPADGSLLLCLCEKFRPFSLAAGVSGGDGRRAGRREENQ